MWDVEAKKLVIKAIAVVESNIAYDAVNYNDPITVGAFQYYGRRAAELLVDIRTNGTWSGVASTIDDDLTNIPSNSNWWNSRYLTRTEGDSLKSALFDNQVVQNDKMLADVEVYKGIFASKGGHADDNTDMMLLFMVAYHQSPRSAIESLGAAGVGATIDRLLAVILNNSVLKSYRSRYQTATNIIKSHDTSGIDLSGSVGTPTEEPDGGDTAPDGSIRNEDIGIRYIRRNGSDLHLVFQDGHHVICPSSQPEYWLVPYDTTQGTAVPPRTNDGEDDDTPPVTGDNPGVKALQWMLNNQERWAYSQGAGRMNPFVSGYTDCSACLYLAYLKTSGINIGTYTTAQSMGVQGFTPPGRVITKDRESIRNGVGMLPGDLIFYKNYNRAGYPFNHVEMYTGDGMKRTIGQVGSTAPGPSLHPMNRYLDWGHLDVLCRRPW